MSHFKRMDIIWYYMGPVKEYHMAPTWRATSIVELSSHGRPDLPDSFQVGHIADLPEPQDTLAYVDAAIDGDFMGKNVDELYKHRL